MYTNQKIENPKIKELIERIKQTEDPRMKLRYDVIILVLQGYHRNEIAKIFNIHPDTVHNYKKSYRKGGIEGLDMGKPPGSKTKLTEEQMRKLYECIVTKTPKDVGYEPFVNWTANLARQWVLREFNVKYSERGMREVMYRLELSYTRPTYVLEKANPEKQEQFKSDFEQLKKNS